MFILPHAVETKALTNTPKSSVDYHLTMIGANITKAAACGYDFSFYTMRKATGNLLKAVVDALIMAGYEIAVDEFTISISWREQ